jgi:hypothetical protein
MTRLLKHFNYTQRVKIPAARVHIDVKQEEDGRCSGIIRRLDLSDHGHHELSEWKTAKVIVEARRLSSGTYCWRPLGSVAAVERAGPGLSFDPFGVW